MSHYELVLARGPFTEADELALFRQHRIDAVVSKNSGGAATYAKIAAARALSLPVVMIARPASVPGDVTADVEGALAWIHAQLEEGAAAGKNHS